MNDDSLISSVAPDFSLSAVERESDVSTISLSDYSGQWLLLIFYPRDFSFVCPTELTSYSLRVSDFERRNCRLLALSVDSIDSHVEWLNADKNDGGIGPLQFPLASDVGGTVARQYGVYSRQDDVSLRGTFLIDPDSIVQYGVIHNLAVGRSVDETLRVLDALQSGGLCPSNWTQADGNIDLDNALKPGRVLGQYRILKILGDGSFGRVFAAWDLRLERSVALKVFRQQTRESRENALREARVAAPLIHPNICTIYAIDEIDGLVVIAMELLDGQNLGEYLKKNSSLTERLQIAEGIAAGLAVAHSQNVVHGDLKPDNIFVGHDGVPRILDFGLASKRQPPSPTGKRTSPAKPQITSIQQDALEETVRMPSVDLDHQPDNAGISGTPAYMAPERWQNQPLSTANDIYSFGLILYELMTGKRALASSSLQQLLGEIQDPGLAANRASQLPEDLAPLCRAMLAHDPKSRPDAIAVNEQLRAATVSMSLI